MPVLETETNAAGGDVILAKVNIDENPELAQALRIQSVPTVMAFFQAQPVTGFTGARPQSDIKNLIGQLVKLARSSMPDALDIPKALQEAAAFLAAGQVMEAQELYMHVLAQDEVNAQAYVGLVRCLIEADAVDQADEMVLNAPDDIAKSPDFAAAKTALTLAKGAGEARKKLTPLLDAVEKAPENHQARFDLAGAQFAAGERAQAIENLLYILQKDRGWNDEAARKELLKFFEAMGFADPLSIDGRKKLSRILFS
jgi:putative thioredoxin